MLGLVVESLSLSELDGSQESQTEDELQGSPELGAINYSARGMRPFTRDLIGFFLIISVLLLIILNYA